MRLTNRNNSLMPIPRDDSLAFASVASKKAWKEVGKILKIHFEMTGVVIVTLCKTVCISLEYLKMRFCSFFKRKTTKRGDKQ